MKNIHLNQLGKICSLYPNVLPYLQFSSYFPDQTLTLLLTQVHFTPSIGSMWVLIKAASDFISYFPDVC